MTNKRGLRRALDAVLPRALHLFYLEDSEDDVFFFERAVKNSGLPIEVVHVADGQAALRKLEEAAAKPDIILLDVGMPRMNGFEFLAEVKKGAAADVPVVVFTTSFRATDIEQARKLGARGYMVKSTAGSELVSMIKRLYIGWASGNFPQEWPTASIATHNEVPFG